MAAIAFDPLEYTHELEASGVPREQAEVHAKAMTATFLHNFDALVTRDYLDTRFTEFETRVEANMDKRFSEFEFKVGKRFAEVDRRFIESEANMDKRFAEVDRRFIESDANMDRRFDMVGKRFLEMEATLDKHLADFRLEMHGEVATVRGDIGELSGTLKLHSWMGGVLVAGMLLPVVERMAAWL